MIALDIETSGLNQCRCGIWQIGAIDLPSGREFFIEGRIDNEDAIEKEALIITGKTEQELRDPSKPYQKSIIESLFSWLKDKSMRNFLCQNPCFDVSYISAKARKYALPIPYGHRSFDLHTIAQLIYYKNHGIYMASNGKSSFDLSKILDYCGFHDTRISLENGKIKKPGTPHSALEDARLLVSCYKKLMELK